MSTWLKIALVALALAFAGCDSDEENTGCGDTCTDDVLQTDGSADQSSADQSNADQSADQASDAASDMVVTGPLPCTTVDDCTENDCFTSALGCSCLFFPPQDTTVCRTTCVTDDDCPNEGSRCLDGGCGRGGPPPCQTDADCEATCMATSCACDLVMNHCVPTCVTDSDCPMGLVCGETGFCTP